MVSTLDEWEQLHGHRMRPVESVPMPDGAIGMCGATSPPYATGDRRLYCLLAEGHQGSHESHGGNGGIWWTDQHQAG